MTDDRRELVRIASRRTRIAVALTLLMCIAYFGFILLVAFDKPLMGTLVGDEGRISVGIILGAIVILCAPVLTGIFVTWANRRYDAALEALRGKQEGER